MKLIGSKWCSNLLYIKILIYYHYNIHNLILHKYYLGLHLVEFFFKSIFHLHVAHFVRLDIFCKYNFFKKKYLILLSRWGFQHFKHKMKYYYHVNYFTKKYFYFQYKKINSWLHIIFFQKE